WQIERGAVNFGAGAPAMPATPVMLIEGSMSRLDLAGYLLLWRQLARSPAWPALHVELTAGELLAADRSIAEVHVSADAGLASSQLRLESADLDARVRWPAVVDPAHPVSAHLERLDLAQFGGGGAAAALISALGSDSQLSVSDLGWRGRSLGSLEATLAARAGALEVNDLHVSGPGGEVRGTLKCRDGACRASLGLASHDAAATLTRLGFRADLSAAHAAASAALEWPTDGTPMLASARGQIHVELEDGLTRGATPGDAAPLGLLAIPGLVAGMGLPQLPFTRLAADFTVKDGQAVTSDLHLDGDTEILMRGRIGLLARDYEAQVWVMKGEERLPGALRRLGPGPRVAALWLSLRELFAGAAQPRAALRLHGTWDDPMVSP
ncbi:MAG TPA: AsmA-like C-terminal region-containing protein, partial [Steroidobacteraceae bacterium]|nr:AsmA-like C-terminal region-containing protein [Steroidobacteraceae bacterium]